MRLPPDRPRATGTDADPDHDLAPRDDLDRILAACSYFFAPIFGWAVYLFAFRTPSYRRYHAQQAIVFGLVGLVVELLFSLPRDRTLTAIAFLLLLGLQFVFAYRAYAAAEPFSIPYVAPLTRRLFPTFPG